MNGIAETCFHCGAPITTGMDVEEGRGEDHVRFCCRGCHGAYLLIKGAGLDDFYRLRDWREPRLGDGVYGQQFKDSHLDRFTYPHGEQIAIDVIIDGIRCASCVWLNEKIIGRMPGVLEVRVNYVTSRARIVFCPEQIRPAAIFSRICELGYSPRPFTVSAAEELGKREKRDLLIRFGTAFFLTMQLMAYSFALYAGYFQGMGATIKTGLQLFSLLVTTPVIFYSGWPFLRGAWRGVVNRAPNMELLIAIGALSSYGYSIYATLNSGEVYFETAATIVTLILAGRLLENAAKRRAAGGVELLLGLTAGEAQRFAGELLETVDVSELGPGDLILIGPGERFPVDGRLVEGRSDVDESPATGESLPVAKCPGDGVIAGSVNLTGTVRIVCEQPASASFIARVARLVEEAQNRRAPIQVIADRTAAFFVPTVLLLALGTFARQYFLLGQTGPALMTALAVVVIACPCALGLATPTAILAGTGAAAASGVIFKGGDVLEKLSRVTVAVFDKTGTLTAGMPTVIRVSPASGFHTRDVIGYAASVESGSLHPIGRALCSHARELEITHPVGEGLSTVAGEGVSGSVGGMTVSVGSARFLAGSCDIVLPHRESLPGETEIYVAVDGRFSGTVTLQDRLRDDAAGVVGDFFRAGIRTLLLSGDDRETVRIIAARVGIDEGVGEHSPSEKTGFVERLRDKGEIVLMVGDGINDAPALAAADVGCALAGGTDIALETSDLVLTKPELSGIIHAVRLAGRTMSIVKQNLVWAFLYNIIGIPLAMTCRLTPVYAAAAMALSSLCVVGNSLRITWYKRG